MIVTWASCYNVTRDITHTQLTSLFAVQPPAVAVLHPQVQVGVAGNEHREDSQRRADFVKLQPVVDILQVAG